MSAKLNEPNVAACHTYFGEFLQGLRGELLIPGLRSLNCILGVQVTDAPGAAWTLVVKSGRLEAILFALGNTQCTFQLDTATLLDIASAELAPDRAFFDLRIEIEGDIAMGLQLSTVLEPFFQQYPFRWQPE